MGKGEKMRLAANPRVELYYKYDVIIIPVEHGQVHEMNRVLENIGQIAFDKEYTVEIKRQRLKRSLDANAYMWTLIGKLGEKLYRSDLEIYRNFIRDNGAFEIVPIRNDAVPTWRKNWGFKGQGWICEDLGECRNFKDYRNIKSYYGSSTYDTKQMSRLIDAVVQDCREQGIETKTPDELMRLKAAWGDGCG